MLSDDASREGRKKEVKINIIITYDLLPPPLRTLLVRNARHVRVDGRMIVGGRGLWAVLWGGCRSCSTDDAKNL
jgi:hypothetical protein